MKISKSIYLILIYLMAWMANPVHVLASNKPEQIVKILSDRQMAHQGEQFKIFAEYNTSDGNKTTGLGIKVYYDSSCVTLKSSEFYDSGDSGIISIPLHKQDRDNDDGDERTDYSISIGWLFWTQSWPKDQDIPFNVMTLTFIVNCHSNCQLANFNVTSTSEDINYQFSGFNHQVHVLDTYRSDINKDCWVNLIDAIELLKHLSQE